MRTISSQLLLLLVVTFNYNAEPTSAANVEAIAKKVADECIKEGSLSAEESTRIMANELFSPKYNDASEKLQCFLLCCYKKIGIIGADGKQKPQVFMDYLHQRFADKIDKIKPALDKCVDIKSGNPCEMAYKFEGCILQNMMA